MGEGMETVKIAIEAPAAIDGKEVRPEIVKQLWKDAFHELSYPREKNWLKLVIAIRSSIEQDGLYTIFDVPTKFDDDEIAEILQRSLLYFLLVRTSIARYVRERYSYKSPPEQSQKCEEVRFRRDIAIALLGAVERRMMVVDLPAAKSGVNANRDYFPPGSFIEAAIAGYMGKTPPEKDIHQQTADRLRKTLGVPAKMLGDTKYSNMATAAQIVLGDHSFSLVNPPRKIGSFPMREDIPVQSIKERLWALLVQTGVQGGAATQLIETAFKSEVVVPIDRRAGTAQGDALEEAKATFAQAEKEDAQTRKIIIPSSKPPLREWGIIREMANLLRETADRGSELNVADRERLRTTAELAKQVTLEGLERFVAIGVRESCQHTIGVQGEMVEAELAKIKEEVKRLIDTFREGHIHQVGPAVPLLPASGSEDPDH